MPAKQKEAYEHDDYGVEAVERRDGVKVSFEEEYKDPLIELLSSELTDSATTIRPRLHDNTIAIKGAEFSDVETTLEDSVERYLDGEDDQDEL